MRRRVPGWASPAAPAVLSGLLLVLAAVLWAQPVTRAADPAAQVWLPWWGVATLVAACEVIVMRLQIRREAQAVSFSELNIVLALFFSTPTQFLIGRVLGSALVFVLWRRQAAMKIVFNTALYLAESCLALAVFHALRDGTSVDPQAWLAALAATTAVGAFAGLAVTVVVGLVGGDLDPRDLVREPLQGALTSGGVTIPALVAVQALAARPIAVLPVVGSFVLLLVGFRAYGALSERHMSLERLYRFSHVISGTQEVDEILQRVLERARDVLRADHAEIVFADRGQLLRLSCDPDGGLCRYPLSEDDDAEVPVWSQVLDDGEPLLVPLGSREPRFRRFLAARDLRDAILVPLRAEAETVGVVLVGDRRGEVRTFDRDDVRLLATVANHAAMALNNAQLIERLRHDSLHDGLTGLPNRTFLNRSLVEAADDVGASRSPGLAVVVMDLVGFKQVNDTLGHHLGDQVLREVSARLRMAVGAGNLVARLGGDEFAALIPGVEGPRAALDAGQRLRSALTYPIRVDGVAIEVGASIGMSMAPLHGEDARTLLTRADAAMYEAKSTGTGLHLYEPGLETTVSPERLAMAGELRQAIESAQLEVHVQPVAALPRGEVVGVEALVRWRHPRLGLLAPEEFVPLAERTGLIGPLTTAVLSSAVSACGHWSRSGHDLSVAVNLSARSILGSGLTDTVAHLLKKHGVPARALTLEITESSIIGKPARALAVLQRLHDMGVRLAIDDFGTGYSSLSYLRQLPVQEVKIDKSFVSTMHHQDSDATIVRSIVDLGSNLGLEVVAEGVEDRETWDDLAAMGCDLVQGYYVAPPMAVADFLHWYEDVYGTSAVSS